MRKILHIFFLIIFLLSSVIPLNFGADTIGEELTLYLGEPSILSVSNPTRIAIGNPAIADVANVSKRELTIIPKSAGTTNLVVWDNYGEQSYMIKVYEEDTAIIQKRVDKILKRLNLSDVTAKADDEEGKVFLLGTVKNSKDKERITAALGGLASKTADLVTVKEEQAIIEIDVQILELDKGATDTLGFTWPGSITLTEIGAPGMAAAGTTFGKVFKLGDLTRAAYTLKIDALIQEGKARVLSRPRLACLSGKEAKLIVGGEVPVLSGTVTPNSASATGTGATTNATVEYKDYGIILNIKPSVEDTGRIHLNLDVEVSELGDTVSTTYALAYTFTTRNASTELYLDDGQTMAIGGIIKQKTEESLRKVPWLADVPVLGMFFRQRTTTKGGGFSNRTDTELFITLTPRIVSSSAMDKEEIKPVVKAEPVTPQEESLNDPIMRYGRAAQQRIVENLIYPAAARQADFQGTVRLSLHLDAQGKPIEVKIKSSSGYKMLDDAALNSALSISTYPPFPSDITREDLWVEIPISFKLE